MIARRTLARPSLRYRPASQLAVLSAVPSSVAISFQVRSSRRSLRTNSPRLTVSRETGSSIVDADSISASSSSASRKFLLRCVTFRRRSGSCAGLP